MRRALPLAVLCMALGGCRAPAGRGARQAELDVYRYPHGAPAHAAIACTSCHPAAAVTAGEAARPGADDHAPCDQGECHADAFLREPGQLCTLCHRVVVPWRAGGTQPVPYPPVAGPRVLAAEFSHARHLDRAGMDARVGFNVTCIDCHERPEDADDLGLPGHAACIRCHSRETSRPARPDIAACTTCHVARRRDVARGRAFIRGDLRFRHATHEADRAGRSIACVTCHREIAQSSRTGVRALPETAVCVACHDDERRSPPHVAMRRCGTCHGATVGAFGGVVTPRSHLPPRDRPEGHTLAFRRDHAAEARRDARACARCHTAMSGSPRDNCDECHQTTRPRDHLANWREFGHGAEAAASADRCATCHVSEYCSACHSQRPRGHYPTIEFDSGGHAAQALSDTRACFACHEPTTSCTRSGCHTGAP